MKRYMTWGVDRSYKFKFQARLSGFFVWVRKGEFKQAFDCLTHKYN